MTRTELLDWANKIVMGNRNEEYGEPEDNFGVIANLWTSYKGTAFSRVDVAMMMALLKIARIKNEPSKMDSYVDLAGYAACGAEIADRESKV